MKTQSLAAIALIAVGMVVLASLGLSFMTPGKPIDFLGTDIAKADGQFIPPVAGALALVVGIVLLMVKPRRV
jgi:hypothetical protein